MMKDPNEAISVLNGLIETCRDSQEGFRKAAEAVKSEDLKELFRSYMRQRAEFVTELQIEVKRLRGSAENTGSLAGAIHRGWADLKKAVAGDDDAAIIAEVERGEDSMVRSYQDALSKSLSDEARSDVDRQLRKIKEAHDKIRALKTSRKVEKEVRR